MTWFTLSRNVFDSVRPGQVATLVSAREMSQTGVQPFPIIRVLDEAADASLDPLERPVGSEFDLLSLETFEEASGLGVVIGIAHGRHADRTDR